MTRLEVPEGSGVVFLGKAHQHFVALLHAIPADDHQRVEEPRNKEQKRQGEIGGKLCRRA